MTKLTDLFTTSALADEIDAGHVSLRYHPHAPLAIANYTAACQYERAWNEVTRQCRGLIYNTTTDEIVARPWPKFFNYGEWDEGVLDPNAPCEVTDKMDGSLGILYPTGTTSMDWSGRHKDYAIATRGSFESEQAVRGTEMLQSYIERGFVPQAALTYLFEIIYPENRIVLDYEGAQKLVLLGTVITESGRALGMHGPGWEWDRAQTFSASTLVEALQIEPRPNAEGIVVRYVGGGPMVKIKQDDYVELHRLVTGLSEKRVWEHLSSGWTPDDICEPLPEEFHPWVRDIAKMLYWQVETIREDALNTYTHILERLSYTIYTDEKQRRAAFAEQAKHSKRAGLLFGLYDRRDILPAIWKECKPAGATRALVTVSEDTA